MKIAVAVAPSFSRRAPSRGGKQHACRRTRPLRAGANTSADGARREVAGGDGATPDTARDIVSGVSSCQKCQLPLSGSGNARRVSAESMTDQGRRCKLNARHNADVVEKRRDEDSSLKREKYPLRRQPHLFTLRNGGATRDLLSHFVKDAAEHFRQCCLADVKMHTGREHRRNCMIPVCHNGQYTSDLLCPE